MNSRINAATEKPGKIPRQKVTSQQRSRQICKPESWQKRDYPEPMKQTVPITRGDDIPPTALKGSCMGKHHATAHSPSQSTASTRRKGDSKRDSLKGFQQPPGAQQPTSVVPLQAFLWLFCFEINSHLKIKRASHRCYTEGGLSGFGQRTWYLKTLPEFFYGRC